MADDKPEAGLYAQIHRRVWSDHEFRSLTLVEQWLYLHLVTTDKMTYSGVCDWRPKRIKPMATDLNVSDIELAASVLQAKGYIVIDEDTEEVFIRSWHRNDECLKQPNMGTAVKKAYYKVTSLKLKDVIVWELQRLHAEHPDWKGWPLVAEVLEKPATDPAAYRHEPLPGADAPAGADTQEAPF
ncbi:hypothetical protein DWB68_10325 [Galactobacter valiniphilus]|uniref:Uncharacterized protein n=1 Tax=Galactobacter valiniphilus TaxID=2676122 RepID=A0A399J8L0_9MICC|nr:hypothetical protein [Galactobacter valiniphilus]RII41913.1 hypothetical protein DWB68_10325 [Galactobacter valiniphilus]